MTSNTKLETNFSGEDWLPAHFSGKTINLSVLLSCKSCTAPDPGLFQPMLQNQEKKVRVKIMFLKKLTDI